MLAAVLHAPGDLRLEEVPEPKPGPGEVELRPAHNGICGSDLHLVDRIGPPTGRPQILGHEFAGVVAGTGERVAVRPVMGCGRCARCRAGLPNLCADRLGFGIRAPGGGLAEAVCVPRDCLVPLPEHVSLAEGALIEPMAVALNAIIRTDVEAGATAVVFGAGAVGTGVFLGLRARGIADVYVVEPSPARRHAIAALGAERVLDPAETDVVDTVKGATDGLGASAVFEAAGSPQSFAAAIAVCAPRGRVAVIANAQAPLELDPRQLRDAEAELIGTTGYAPGVYEEAAALMASGAYPSAGWVEHIRLDDLHEGLEALRRGERMKLVVDL